MTKTKSGLVSIDPAITVESKMGVIMEKKIFIPVKVVFEFLDDNDVFMSYNPWGDYDDDPWETFD